MTKKEIREKILNITNGGIILGIEIFALLKNENGEKFEIKRVRSTEKLLNDVARKLSDTLTKTYLAEDVEFESAENIADNKNIFYEIVQNVSYYPFQFLDVHNEITACYNEHDRANLTGLFFRINHNDDCFWCYQHVYAISKMDKSKNILAFFANNTYDSFKDDVIQINGRIDFTIIDRCIITKKINLLENSFGFETFIRAGAKETIETIENLKIVEGLEKFIAFENKSKLTNAKKLMKARKSPVLKMKKEILLQGIKQHRRYSKIFKIEESHIIISSQKDVAAFIKMINDDYVTSELTGQEYDSSSKQIVAPIEN